MRDMTTWCGVSLALLAIALPVRAGDPTVAEPARTPRQEKRVSQYGISWEFDRPSPVGQFVNGDYYVVGPVTIARIEPKPLVGPDVPASEISDGERKFVTSGKYIRNGSMLNPPARQAMAYDSGLRQSFAPDLVTAPPYALKPGDVLVSTISLKMGENAAIVGYGNSSRSRAKHDNCPINGTHRTT